MIADAQDPDIPVIYVNHAAEKITGYSAEEIIGKNCRFLQKDDLHQEGAYLLRDSIKESRPVTTVLRNYRKDGTMFWNEVSISPVRDKNGVLTHLSGCKTM